jgi:uncharacterized protein YbaR (Trm112 family)
MSVSKPPKSVRPSLNPKKSIPRMAKPEEFKTQILEDIVADCPVCAGDVVEGREVRESERGHSMIASGIYCKRCGVMFKFIPPKIKK